MASCSPPFGIPTLVGSPPVGKTCDLLVIEYGKGDGMYVITLDSRGHLAGVCLSLAGFQEASSHLGNLLWQETVSGP